jgi:hypothetical protein
MSQSQRLGGHAATHSTRSHVWLGALGWMLRGSLTALALVVSIGVWTPPALAASFGWAYLWANQPTSPSYTPSLSYQFNSSGSTNTVMRTGVGAYTALLPNLGTAAGVVHVTAYGGGTEVCKVGSWDPSGSTQQVHVQCFTSGGAPVDTLFTMTYAYPRSAARPMAFLWADQPTAATYTPSLSYQFNSSGATNTVRRMGVGTYTALLPNLGAATGHVQVTAYGPGSERCKVGSWDPSGSTQQVHVQCFTSAGMLVDTRFTMTYVSDISLVGSPCDTEPGTCSAYVWADQPPSPSYTPALSYQFSDIGATNMITRVGVGAYWVQLPDQNLNSGDVQVSAYGAGAAYCKVAYWTPWAGVQVRCFSSAGLPVDTYFDVTFLFSYLIG